MATIHEMMKNTNKDQVWTWIEHQQWSPRFKSSVRRNWQRKHETTHSIWKHSKNINPQITCLITCIICMKDELSSYETKKCGHVKDICKECMTDWYKTCLDHGRQFTCPYCRIVLPNKMRTYKQSI